MVDKVSNSMELIFVYNADGNLTKINKIKDFYNKLLRPKTYPCKLCAVTYGNFGMKKQWKDYVNNLEISAKFLHKDEFEKEYNIIDAKYPCAYLKTSSGMKLLVSQKEMNNIDALEQLENMINEKLESTS